MKKLLRKLFLATLLCLPLTAMAQVNVGDESRNAEKAALLDFKTQTPSAHNATTNKGGLLLPRVELVDRLTLEPFIANASNDEKRRHTGLTVYNLTEDEPADLVAGIFYWDGSEWRGMLTAIPQTGVNMSNLVTNTSSGQGDEFGGGGNAMNYGVITAPEDGSYAFNFRFYGGISNPGTNARCRYFITVWVNDGVNNVLVDSAEIDIYTPDTNAGNRYTAATTLVATASAGETITFKIAHPTGTNRSWDLVAAGANPLGAARTSMLWWKL